MPEKIATLARMLIYPNTQHPGNRDYIIAAFDINFEYYCADTDSKAMHDDFWNVKLGVKGRTAAIQGMLNALEGAYGHKFRYIQPWGEDEIKHFRRDNLK